MCFAVQCPMCSKTTWKGCGMHIESVKAQVAPENWCTCPRPDAPTAAQQQK